jgi:S1-C subfamily serine protease
MSAFVRSPFVAAMVGGLVVAVVLIAFDVVGDADGGGATTTVIQQAPVDAASSSAEQSDAPTPRHIYERDAPGVVFVRAQASASASSSPFGQQGSGDETSGTGFVIDEQGHILTNHHVVGDARTVRVGFSDDRTVTARVLGNDPRNDLALLEVDPDEVDLSPLELGDSSSARVGDPVLTIGNPFGLDRTLTTGVVSALQRQLTAPNGFAIEHVIQTDAPINPGNSGGPLLDGAGRVIGINSQIATNGTSSGSVGIGFAVPINTARRLLPQLMQTGTVEHAYLGITGMTIDDTLADVQLSVDRGVLVQTVHADSPAARAGLAGGTVESMVDGHEIQLGGDVIQTLDGEPLEAMTDLTAAMAERRPGDRIRLGILRGGATRTLEIRLGVAPRTLPSVATTP